MLERLTIRNFKRFDEVEIELGDVVVFIGPNNSGKTSALQALALWELGVRRWQERRAGKEPPKERTGVTLNRRDLVSLPVPNTNLLWRNLHVREVGRANGKQKTSNVRIDVVVDGVGAGEPWTCGLEFDYANVESLYCRPLGWSSGSQEGPGVPAQATQVRIAYLPPMSGLAANEDRLDPGAIAVRLGEGRTAEVLRNLCYQLHPSDRASESWSELSTRIEALFGVSLDPPEYVPERGEVRMSYRERGGTRLDLSSAGRGLQQTMLLLSYMLANPGAVLLLDEPDAHLEILRQKQIYATLSEVAQQTGSQVIAASHSEVILNEAGDRDVLVAFVGKPHRVDDRGQQAAKALKSIGFDQYYQAELRGWVLYLEGATDLAILRAFARVLEHPAARHLEDPFTHYVGNQPKLARDHFHGLREAKPDLVGLLLTDRLGREPSSTTDLVEAMWSRREIENYLCTPSVLEAYAVSLAGERSAGPLFALPETERLRALMRRAIEDRVPPAALRDPSDRWWRDEKATDAFLDPLFEAFFRSAGLPNLMRKTDYHRLAAFVEASALDPEIATMLDRVVEIAERASPRA